MLTDTRIRKTAPGPKTQYLADTTVKGLRLEIRPDGKRYWRFRFTYNGKPKLSGLGKYPDLDVAAARSKATKMRAQVAQGSDPILERKRASVAAHTVREVGNQWFTVQAARWSADHAKRVGFKLQGDVYPEIGHLGVGDVKPPDVLRVANRLVKRGAVKSAKEVVGHIGAICRFGIGIGIASEDPTVHLRGVVQSPPRPTNHPALLASEDVGEFLRALEASTRSDAVKTALWTAILTWQRVGTIRLARWEHMDLDKREWLVTPDTNKTGVEMIVPLPTQLVERLKALPQFNDYVFSLGNGPIGAQVPMKLVTAIGYKGRATVHGFRATGRTVAHETLGYSPEVCEAQLLHISDKHSRAYNRTLFREERHRLIQKYADLLQGWQNG